MTKHNQKGSATTILIFVILGTLVVGLLVFGLWAFSSRQSYKNDVDAKVAAAVTDAKAAQQTKDAAAAAEAAKQPLTAYHGPEAYGSIVMMYPKTWSGYVEDSGTSGAPVDGFFAPGVVPSTGDPNSVFAVRIQVNPTPYAQLVQSAGQSQTPPVVTAYSLPKVPNVVGVKIVGTLPGTTKTGEMIILPLRDKSLQIWTVGDQSQNDFNNLILPNFSFSP